MAKVICDKMDSPSEYISPKELVHRWRVSRSSVDRLVRKAGFKALYLSDGRTSMVRFLREEVIAYELSRQISLRE